MDKCFDLVLGDQREHIARISYGKDSLKMLNVIYSRGLRLDRITTTDVWATDTIPAWLPPMDSFKSRMDEWIWRNYHIEVEHLCARNKDGSKKTYEQMFYHIPVRRSKNVQVERETNRDRIDSRIPRLVEPLVSSRTQEECKRITSKDGLYRTDLLHGVRNSKQEWRPQGFPVQISNWCKKLKIDYVRTPFFDSPPRRAKRNIVEYIGIAADEPDRFSQLSDTKRAPLVEFGIDEDLCGLYCKYSNQLAPTYETSCRDGCWFCHNQGVNQLRNLRKNYPDRWAMLLKWDLDSPVSFKADGHTVHDYDERFRLEDEMLIDPEKPFRWNMLNGDLQKRLF